MDSRAAAPPPPLNYRRPRPLEYAVLDDEGDAMTHNDGCTCRTCRRWDAVTPSAATVSGRERVRAVLDEMTERAHDPRCPQPLALLIVGVGERDRRGTTGGRSEWLMLRQCFAGRTAPGAMVVSAEDYDRLTKESDQYREALEVGLVCMCDYCIKRVTGLLAEYPRPEDEG